MTSPYLRHFTSESVTEGHPDKICDQISDAVLDSLLAQDPSSKVAVETLVTTGLVHVAGEVKSSGYADVASIVRDVITGIGYDSSDKGFDGHSCGVSVSIGAQSSDISAGVENSFERRSGTSDDSDHGTSLGAGDQGLMFGYADDTTDALMPLPIHIAHRLSERLAHVRKEGTLPYLRPDGKTQVTIGYDGDEAVSLEAVVVSTQHDRHVSQEQLSADVTEAVIRPVLADFELETSGTTHYINPAGAFVIGGPMGDAGLTGRKIIVDTYGGFARHGGGDPRGLPAASGGDHPRTGAHPSRLLADLDLRPLRPHRRRLHVGDHGPGPGARVPRGLNPCSPRCWGTRNRSCVCAAAARRRPPCRWRACSSRPPSRTWRARSTSG